MVLSTTYERSCNWDLFPDDMANFLAFHIVPNAAAILEAEDTMLALPANSTSSNNVLGVLDAMQADLFQVLWAQMVMLNNTNPVFPHTHVVDWTAGPLCRSNLTLYGPLDVACNGDNDPHRISRWYSTAGDEVYDADFLAPFNTTLLNMFITLRDAIM